MPAKLPNKLSSILPSVFTKLSAPSDVDAEETKFSKILGTAPFTAFPVFSFDSPKSPVT